MSHRDRGPIKVSLPEDEPVEKVERAAMEVLDLPDNPILDAGVAKFMEYANLHWPVAGAGDFKLTSFDYRNEYHLRVALGVVYMAMRKADGLEPGDIAQRDE